MTLKEYIKQAKIELDAFEMKYKSENKKDPNNWPLEMDEEDWGEQELFFRLFF